MTRKKWLNLVMASLLGFYMFYIVWELRLGTLCGQIGVDYCDYWSAGRVANGYGYARIYDLEILNRVEKSILPSTADPTRFGVVPFPYLPVFVIPFQLLSLLTPPAGFWIWNAVNTFALFGYLAFFSSRLRQQVPSTRLVLLLLVALPVYLNIFSGQVNVWLGVCVGEFMRALVDGRRFRAGLWLGGLLLKPQVLVLIGLVLVLRRSTRILAGLAACASVLLLASLLQVGAAGLVDALTLWTVYARGQASIWLEGMMNWRMIGFHASSIAGQWAGLGVVAAGMLLTLVVVLRAWGRRPNSSNPLSPRAVLGIFAATTALAWHSHIHMAILLIPPMLFLFQTGELPARALESWVLVPAILFLPVVFAPEAIAKLNMGSYISARSVYFVIGAAELGVNLYLLWWAANVQSIARDP
jgi:hypothetical protein